MTEDVFALEYMRKAMNKARLDHVGSIITMRMGIGALRLQPGDEVFITYDGADYKCAIVEIYCGPETKAGNIVDVKLKVIEEVTETKEMRNYAMEPRTNAAD